MNTWNVIDREAGVMTCEYEFAPDSEATAFAARMEDGRMMIISPPTDPLQAVIDEILSYGDIGAFIVNNGMHHMGLALWMEKFPDARVFAPEASRARIAKKEPALAHCEPLESFREIAGDAIGFREAPQAKVGKSWFWVRSGSGYVWFVSDILINLRELPKKFLPRAVFSLTGSAPGYHVFHLMLMMSVQDKRETLKILLDDLTEHTPHTIVPAHGDVITGENVFEDTREVIAPYLPS